MIVTPAPLPASPPSPAAAKRLEGRPICSCAPVRIDGYAQAGFVGLQRRDGFVDGAFRSEHPVRIGPVLIGIGSGLWGAAQPAARRIDAGPRLSIRLPIANRTVSLALEGRFRLAGNARPGSGLALTLAGDL